GFHLASLRDSWETRTDGQVWLVRAARRLRAKLLRRPQGAFCDHGIFVIAELFQRRQKFAIAAVAHRNRGISFQAAQFRTPDGGAAERFAEVFRRHLGPPLQCRVDEVFARLKFRGGAYRSFAVPRADVLADVAAEDVPAHAFAQFIRNRSTLFDAEIRDALVRVELVRA